MTSKELVRQSIPGWEGRLAAHHVAYLGDGHVHRDVPYNATDPKVIAKKLDLMQSDGIDIVIATWQGIYATSCNLDATLMSAACAQRGMQFALLLDPWCAKLSYSGSNTNYTQNVTTSLQAASTQTMLNASSYMPEKYVLDFNTGANLAALGKTFKTLNFLAMGVGFSWIAIPPTTITDSPAKNAWAVANLKSQHANPAMKIASFCDGFNDSGMPLPAGVQSQAAFDAAGGVRDLTQSVWGGPARILGGFAGLFAQQQLATIPVSMPVVTILTWDDHDERSSGPREAQVAKEYGINWPSL
jgi:hypothetical protein